MDVIYDLIKPYDPAYLKNSRDFIEKNTIAWEKTLQKIFGINVPYPSRQNWVSKEDIINVLNVIGEIPDSNHLIFPEGGLDLKGATFSTEDNCIELIFENQIYICQPDYLQFVSFQADIKWFYFRFETKKLKAIYAKNNFNAFCEELIELDDGEFVSNNKENDAYVSKHFYRRINRILSGSMVIFAKSSMYNHDPSTYDGKHNKMTPEEFQKYIQKSIEKNKT